MRITKSENQRIEVYLHDYRESTVARVMREIKKHVDDIAGVSYRRDIKECCSHCGYGWEVDEDGSPLCCNKAIEEWKLAALAGEESNG